MPIHFHRNIYCLLSVVKCAASIPNGAIQQPCNFEIGTQCDYICNVGFKRSAMYRNVTCDKSGNWAIRPKTAVCLSKVFFVLLVF